MSTVVQSPPEASALIAVDDLGVARIAGSRLKVSHIAVEHTRLGQTPEQIVAAFPHLTLAQVEAALSYYYAHRAAVEAQIAEAAAFADRMQAAAEPSPVAARLRANGLLPPASPRRP